MTMFLKMTSLSFHNCFPQSKQFYQDLKINTSLSKVLIDAGGCWLCLLQNRETHGRKSSWSHLVSARSGSVKSAGYESATKVELDAENMYLQRNLVNGHFQNLNFVCWIFSWQSNQQKTYENKIFLTAVNSTTGCCASKVCFKDHWQCSPTSEQFAPQVFKHTFRGWKKCEVIVKIVRQVSYMLWSYYWSLFHSIAYWSRSKCYVPRCIGKYSMVRK